MLWSTCCQMCTHTSCPPRTSHFDCEAKSEPQPRMCCPAKAHMYIARRADCSPPGLLLLLLLTHRSLWLLRPQSITFAPRLGRSLARYMLLKQWRIVVMQDADK